MTFIKDTPENIDELIKDANQKHSWNTRLSALNELRKYDCPQSREVIIRLALHDKVYRVKEEAFRAAQALGLTKNGKPIQLRKKNIGYKSSDFTKQFQRIKFEKKMDEFDLTAFKDTFESVNPEMFDVMSFEKGNNFDIWIKNTFNGLPKK